MRASDTVSVPADADAAEEHALSDHPGPKGVCVLKGVNSGGGTLPPEQQCMKKKESAVPRANIGDSPDSEEIFFEFFSGQELDCDSDTPRTDCPGDDDRKKAAPHLEHSLVFIVQRVDKKDSKIILQGRLHP